LEEQRLIEDSIVSTALESAIARINSVRNRLCHAQIYCFDDYDPATGDATALCNRLGIPVIDDIVVQFPVEATFAPLARSQIAMLEMDIGSRLPDDYKRLLAEFGPLYLPGKADIGFYSPEVVIKRTCRGWRFDNPATMPVLSISAYHCHCDGDSIGFIREGNSFGPELYRFKHERRSDGDEPTKWTERLAGSLAEFILSYIE
jgi:hypothetical protein